MRDDIGAALAELRAKGRVQASATCGAATGGGRLPQLRPRRDVTADSLRLVQDGGDALDHLGENGLGRGEVQPERS
jgi:hypothetical protein